MAVQTSGTTGTLKKDPPLERRIQVPEWVQLRLWVKSGGLCEFNGCNADLYIEKLTLKPDKLANIAHIVAATPGGPRGDNPLPLEERNNFENLMLVCLEHHSHFDKRYVSDYPSELLRQWKRDHEQRIKSLLSLPPGAKTKVIRMRGKVGEETASISEAAYRNAILPNYPLDTDGIEIDLTSIPDSGESFNWEACKAAIKRKTQQLHESPMSGPPADHISVFGFGPIPLLMYLGRCLGNKIPATLYQRHRDTQSWSWKKESDTPARFQTEKVQTGTKLDSAIVIMSLSGTIALEQIPSILRENRDVYLMTPVGSAPNPGLMNTSDDLERFRIAYQELLAIIRAAKPQLTDIHLFPAIPITVALSCGRELLEKAHPSLHVYDYNKKNGEFQFALKVN